MREASVRPTNPTNNNRHQVSAIRNLARSNRRPSRWRLACIVQPCHVKTHVTDTAAACVISVVGCGYRNGVRVCSCGVKPNQAPGQSAQPATAPSKRPFFVSFVEGEWKAGAAPQVDMSILYLWTRVNSLNAIMLQDK
jgi:hypothetical protein